MARLWGLVVGRQALLLRRESKEWRKKQARIAARPVSTESLLWQRRLRSAKEAHMTRRGRKQDEFRRA